MWELQLVLREDNADGAREVSPDGVSWYSRGPLDLEGGRRRESVDSKANPDDPGDAFLDGGPPDGSLCGNSCLVSPGVPGVMGV
jgi:hypothetical protein